MGGRGVLHLDRSRLVPCSFGVCVLSLASHSLCCGSVPSRPECTAMTAADSPARCCSAVHCADRGCSHLLLPDHGSVLHCTAARSLSLSLSLFGWASRHPQPAAEPIEPQQSAHTPAMHDDRSAAQRRERNGTERNGLERSRPATTTNTAMRSCGWLTGTMDDADAVLPLPFAMDPTATVTHFHFPSFPSILFLASP